MQIRKKRSNKPVYLIFSAVILALGGVGYLRFFYNQPAEQLPVSSVRPAVDQEIDGRKPERAVEQPVRLVIDLLGIDAPIVGLGLDEDGAMAAPGQLETVGWYDKSSKIGQTKFSILLDGHYGVDPEPGVFRELNRLGPGDSFVLVGASGLEAKYVITETENQPLEDVDMERALYYGGSDKETVVIITCDGVFDPSRVTYDQRHVVYAERVDLV